MNSIRLLAIALVSLALVACGDPLTKEEAERAWPATGNAVHGADSSGAALTEAVTDPLGVSVDAPCPEGGKLEVEVSLSDVLNAANGEFGYQVNLDDCKNLGLTMNGEIQYGLKVETNGNDTSLEWSWEGDVDYSGTLATPPCEATDCTVEGDCEFDMSGRLAVSAGATDTDPTSVELEYSGNFCGYDASGGWLNVTTTP